jgi:hypothetical protein
VHASIIYSNRRNLPSLHHLIPIALFGCDGDSRHSFELAAQEKSDELLLDILRVDTDSTIPTVVHLDWKSNRPTLSEIHYWSDGQEPQILYTSESPVKIHGTSLIGLHASTEYSIKFINQELDGPSVEKEVSVTTGGLSSHLPVLDVDTLTETSGYTLIPLVTPEDGSVKPSLVILDSAGEYVWYYLLPEHSICTSAEFGLDGSSVLLMSGQTLLRIPLNGEAKEIINTPDAHHDFAQVSETTVAFLQYEYAEYGGKTIIGDSIVEVDEEGTLTEIWNFFDRLDVFGLDAEQLAELPGFVDMTHSNSLEYVASEDSYYLGMSAFPAVVKIDRSTGDVIWSLGPNPALTYAAEMDETIVTTHQTSVTEPDNFLLFVNTTEEDDCAKVARFYLDDESQEFDFEWLYGEDECLTVFGLGGVTSLPNDSTIVVWSTAGRLEQYDSSGQLLQRIENNFGYAFGYADHVGSLYDFW